MGGQKVKCAKCGQKIRLPQASPLPAPAASASLDDFLPISAASDPFSAPANPFSAANPFSSPPIPSPPALSPPRPVEPQYQYQCSLCSQSFAVDDVYDQQGVVICKDCFERQQAGAIHPAASTDAEQMGSGAFENSADAPPPPGEQSYCQSCGVAVSANQAHCEHCAMAAAVTTAVHEVAAPASPPRKPPKQKSPYTMWWIVGGAMSAVLVISFIIIAASAPSRHPTVADDASPEMRMAVVKPAATAPAAPVTSAPTDWLAAHHAEIDTLRVQGTRLETGGDLDQAAGTYQKLLALARSAPQADDTITGLISAAEASLSAVRAKIAAAPATQPAMPETPVAGESSKPTSVSHDPQPAVPPSPQPAAVTPAVVQASGNWETQHGAQAKALLQKADASMAAKDTFKAALIYQQLFGLVGSHMDEIQDADLKKQITNAAATRGKLLAQLKSSPDSLALTAGTLLATGLQALNQKQWKAGLESLTDVRDLFDRNIKVSDRVRNPDYVMALHGMAVAYLSTKQTPKAGELFEDNSPLGSAVDRDLTREMVINRAVTDIIQRTKAMRAAKSLKAFLEKHPTDVPDEKLLNLFGTALFIADQHTANKTFLNQCAALYATWNTKLEATRPGEKRYGITWCSVSEADKRFAERQAKIDEYQKQVNQTNTAFNYWKRQEQLYQPHGPSGMRETTMAAVNAAEGNYNNLAHAAVAAKTKIPNLDWLTDLEPVLPPMPKNLTVVAAADPASEGSSPVFSIQALKPSEPSSPANGSDSMSTSTSPPASPSPEPTPPEPAPAKPIPVRIPRHALAFAIDLNRLVTSAEVVGSATDVRMENANGDIYDAHVIAKEGSLALLELSGTRGRLPFLNIAASFTGGPVQCAAVPQANVFGPQPVLLAGQAGAAPQQGDWFVSLENHPRLAGSPVLDSQGQVVGVVVARRDEMKSRLTSVGLSALRAFLEAHSALPAKPSTIPDPMGVFEVTVQEN
jgi:tetratricopeptide (TPR) repeat protein